MNKFQRQIGEYNLLLSDYMARLAILDDMINLVKLQTEFPFKELEELRSGLFAADNILKPKEKEQIKKAKNNRELYQALCTIREKMVSAVDQEESFLIFSKGHKRAEKHQNDTDNAARRLYALLTAPALRSELNRYIDSLGLTKTLLPNNGNYGAVETFNFERKLVPLDKFNGSIHIIKDIAEIN